MTRREGKPIHEENPPGKHEGGNKYPLTEDPKKEGDNSQLD